MWLMLWESRKEIKIPRDAFHTCFPGDLFQSSQTVHIKLSGLFQRLRSGLLLQLLHFALEPALFLGGLNECGAMQALYCGDVDAADSGLYLFLYRNGFKNAFFTDKRHNLRANLRFYDGKLGTTQQLWSLFYDGCGKSCVLQLHPFLVNNQHGDGLLVSFDLLLLFGLLLLGFLAEKIQNNNADD